MILGRINSPARTRRFGILNGHGSVAVLSKYVIIWPGKWGLIPVWSKGLVSRPVGKGNMFSV